VARSVAKRRRTVSVASLVFPTPGGHTIKYDGKVSQSATSAFCLGSSRSGGLRALPSLPTRITGGRPWQKPSFYRGLWVVTLKRGALELNRLDAAAMTKGMQIGVDKASAGASAVLPLYTPKNEH
jgi:hypothetical protein